MKNPTKLAIPLALSLALAAGDAAADWPMARHDGKRTGLAQGGKSNIHQPMVAWSAYLGGSIIPPNLLVHDVDGDGQGDVILLTGGVVAAKKSDDTLLWSTRIYGIGFLLGIDDLDGDGKLEVLARTSTSVFAMDLATGAMRWAQPAGEMGQIAFVRIADLDGDKLPELVITECGGCGASKPQTGFIYSFGAGFASPTRTSLQNIMGVTTALTVGQPDPASPAHLLLNETASTLALLDGKTGQKIASSPDVGLNMAWATACVAGDIDGVPGDEFVCVASDNPEPSPTAADVRKVYALKYDAPKAALDLAWVHQLPGNEALSNDYDDPLIDLDGDGKLETVVTGRHADGTYVTHVLDAATGAELASIPGQRWVGAPFLESSKQRDVLTVSGATTTAWVYNGAAKAFVKRWKIDDRRPPLQPNLARMRVSSAAPNQPITLDPSGDGSAVELLLLKISPGSEIDAFVTTAATLTEVGSQPYKADVYPIGVWGVGPVTLGTPQVAVATSDGVLGFLSPKLAQAPGKVRFGGFYATGAWQRLGDTPVIGSLGGPANAILAHDSRGRVVRLDASKATPDSAPVEVWAVNNASAPIILPGAQGAAVLYHDPATDPPAFGLMAIDPPSGKVLWNQPLGAQPIGDLAFANFSDFAEADIAVQTVHPGDNQLWTRGFTSTSGKPLFNSLASPGLCGLQPSGYTVTDWNGDGADDVVQVLGDVRADSGKDGTLIAEGDTHPCYFLATPVDVNKDGVDELVLHAGSTPVVVLGHDMKTPLYLASEDDDPYPYGAVATCDDHPVLVEGSWRYPSRLKITDLGGPTMGAVKSLFLVGGKSFPDEASAKASGDGFGQLTATSIHPDLAGDGKPMAVVGSGDGWLYGVDPCAGELRFTRDFGFAVGEAIFGDSDGDGLDEILVSVADGNLYGLKNDPDSGTGGAGGGTSTSGAGGGEGGAGGGGSKHIGLIPIYGRAGCFCSTPASPVDGGPAALTFASALLAALRRRRRAR